MKNTYLFKTVILIVFGITSTTTSYSQDQKIQKIQKALKQQEQQSANTGSATTTFSTTTRQEQIKIPICTIQEDNIEAPIFISCNNEGNQVRETSSWVGLGWSLNAGGAITRKVIGSDDFSREGYYFNSNNVNNSMIFNNNPIDWYGLLNTDASPDIFNFQVNSFSGQFVIYNQKVVLLSQQALKVDVIVGESESEKKPVTFVITDSKGIKYTFSETEYRITQPYEFARELKEEKDIPQPCPNSDSFAFKQKEQNCDIAWHLTKIESPTGGRINLTYVDEISLDYYAGRYEYNQWFVTHFYSYVENHSKRLTQISWPRGSILFDAENVRADLSTPASDGTKPARALTGIRLFNGDGDLVRQFALGQSYMQDPLSSGFLSQRLVLNSLTEQSPDSKESQMYKFDYYPGSLPARYSKSIDYWGFYLKNDNTTLKPNLYKYSTTSALYPSNYCILSKHGNSYPIMRQSDGVNLDPNILDTKVGVISKITYPTGGYTTYEYELNDYYLDGNIFTGGGLRISAIKTYEGANASPLIKQFEYRDPTKNISSGRIISLPILGYNAFFRGGTPLRFSTSQAELQRTRSGFIGYTTVTEKQVNPTGKMLGETIYQYSCPGSYGETDDGCDDGDVCALMVMPVYYHSFYPREQSLIDDYIKDNDLALPAIPEYDWNRGLLLKEITKDASLKTLREVEYTYNKLEDWHISKVPGIRFKSFGDDRDGIFGVSRYYIPSGWRYLKECKETNYTDSGQPIVNIERYSYDNYGHMLPTKVEICNSDNTIKTKKIYYGLDNPSGISTDAETLAYLNDNHILSTVLKEEVFVDSMQIDGTITNYQLTERWGIVPVCSSINKYTGGKYVTQVIFDDYNENNKLLGYHNFGDVNISFIRGPLDYIFAKLVNACYHEVAYTGFEENSSEITTNQWVTLKTTPWSIYTDAMIGNKCAGTTATDAIIYCSGLPSGKYTVSLYAKRLNNSIGGKVVIPNGYTYDLSDEWHLLKKEITINSSQLFEIKVTNAKIDELTLIPVGAQITTYTWMYGVGITSETDTNGQTTHYEYDGLGRLTLVKDSKGNVLKRYDYNYQRQ